MQINKPIEILKKKVTQTDISYKFRWSQGSISMQPMPTLTPEMLELVEKYELSEPKIQKFVKLNHSSNLINNGKLKQQEKNFESEDSIQEEKMEHPQRNDVPCQIKAIRNTNDKMELLVLYQGQEEVWVNLEYLTKRSPVTLCNFLLSKVRWGGNP